MKKCAICGNMSNGNNNNFCKVCGGKLVSLKTEVCNKCGAAVESGSSFCEKCGAMIGANHSSYSEETRENIHLRDSIETGRQEKGKYFTVMIAAMVAVIVCMVLIIVITLIMLINNANYDSGADGNVVAESAVTESAYAGNVISEESLYDYDMNSDDWYRLRKSKWDPTTQIGAYKTVKKALEDARIYRPYGYVLYDKDFNVID